jgi:hypothetical protein
MKRGCSLVRNSPIRVPRLAFGVWRLAFGVWRLAFGVWRSAFGVWRSAMGQYATHTTNEPSERWVLGDVQSRSANRPECPIRQTRNAKRQTPNALTANHPLEQNRCASRVRLQLARPQSTRSSIRRVKRRAIHQLCPILKRRKGHAWPSA